MIRVRGREGMKEMISERMKGSEQDKSEGAKKRREKSFR